MYGMEKRRYSFRDIMSAIQKFASDGTFLTAFGKEGTGPGEFQYPLAVTVADDGTVFVTDFGNNRVQKWQPIGSP